MKKSTVIAGLGITLILILGIIFMVKIMPSGDNTPSETPSKLVTVLEMDDADKVNIRFGDTDLTFNNTAGVWSMDGTNPEDTSSQAINLFVTNALTYRTQQFLEGEASDYGLDKPNVEIHVQSDGMVHNIYIGDRSAVDNVYFANADGKLFTMPASQYESLVNTKEYYTTFSRITMNIDNITNIKIIRNNEEIELYLPKAERVEGNVWRMSKPYNCMANDTYIDENVLPSLTSISLEKTAETLGTESGMLSIIEGDKVYDLKIGERNGSNVMVEYNGKVYSETAELFDFMNADIFNYISKLVSYVNINDVASVKLDYNEKMHNITLDENAPDEMRKFYSEIIGVIGTSMYNGEAKGEELLKVAFVMKDGSEKTAVYNKINEYSASVEFDNSTLMITGISDVENLKSAADEYFKE